nr:hypothetical protein [Actinocrinis sp.]
MPVREIEAVANTLNGRPRMTLGWKTPAEALNEQLLSASDTGYCHDRFEPSQYHPKAHRNALRRMDIRGNTGRTGSCLDGAVEESFFATIKAEPLAHANARRRLPVRRPCRSSAR